jgi:pyruvate dehydrogenase E1 component beta subunit
MAQLSYRDAVARGIAQEMRRDDRVVFLGEDIAAAGGVFKTTAGLLEEFGPRRVRDTPISEQAILGAAMGAAMTGLRPIARSCSATSSPSAGTWWPTRSPRPGT